MAHRDRELAPGYRTRRLLRMKRDPYGFALGVIVLVVATLALISLVLEVLGVAHA